MTVGSALDPSDPEPTSVTTPVNSWPLCVPSAAASPEQLPTETVTAPAG